MVNCCLEPKRDSLPSTVLRGPICLSVYQIPWPFCLRVSFCRGPYKVLRPRCPKVEQKLKSRTASFLPVFPGEALFLCCLVDRHHAPQSVTTLCRKRHQPTRSATSPSDACRASFSLRRLEAARLATRGGSTSSGWQRYCIEARCMHSFGCNDTAVLKPVGSGGHRQKVPESQNAHWCATYKMEKHN